MHTEPQSSAPPAAVPACRICLNANGNRILNLRESTDGPREMFAYVVCGACGCMQIKDIPEDMTRYYSGEYYSFKRLDRFASSRLSRFFNSRRVAHALGRGNFIGYLINRFSRPVDYLEWMCRAGAGQESRILDVGCGSGKLLLRMYQGGFRNCIGMDPYIENTIEYPGGVRIVRVDIRDYARRPEHEHYDLIMFHHSFEHLEHPLEALQAARQLLRPKGCILIRLPVCDSYAWEQYGDEWGGLQAPTHFFLHTKKSINAIAQRAGLVVTDTVYDAIVGQLIAGEAKRRSIVPERGKRARDYFTKAEIAALQRQTDELNVQQRGDQAGFYLRLP